MKLLRKANQFLGHGDRFFSLNRPIWGLYVILDVLAILAVMCPKSTALLAKNHFKAFRHNIRRYHTAGDACCHCLRLGHIIDVCLAGGTPSRVPGFAVEATQSDCEDRVCEEETKHANCSRVYMPFRALKPTNAGLCLMKVKTHACLRHRPFKPAFIDDPGIEQTGHDFVQWVLQSSITRCADSQRLSPHCFR